MNGDSALSLQPWVRFGACLALALSCQAGRSAIILQGPDVIERNGEGGRAVVPKPRDAQDDRSAAVDPAYADTLRFINGDVLHGNLVSMDGEKSLRWRTPDAKGDIEFSQAKLAKVMVFRSTKAPTGTNKVQAVLVRLTNGDEMVGELESLDADKLVVNTVFAGPLTFPRKYVQGLRLVAAAPNAIFEGPTGLDGWTARNKAWRYGDGGFVTTKQGAIGRDLKLPASARIEFDVAWRSQLQLMVHFYTDGFDENYGANNAYMLQMSQGYMFMQRVRRNMGGNNIGQIEAQSLIAKRKVHVELLCNKEAKTIALLLDGNIAKQWKEPMEWVGAGTGLMFTMQGMGWHRVSNIRVSEWDGKIEEHSTTTATKSKEDMMEMSNHDRVTGNLQTIKDGKLVFVTAFANMDIPMDRMFCVDLAAAKAEYPLKKFTDVKGLFVGRGSLTFAVDKYDGQQLVVNSPNFGTAKFNAAAFNQFVFNIEAQAKAALDDFDLDDDSAKQ